jgi:hypothetical protein
MEIRPFRADDEERLRQVARASNAHWGFVAARAESLGALRLEWAADPNSVGFYERMGARLLRHSPPSEWGRILPVMGIEL